MKYFSAAYLVRRKIYSEYDVFNPLNQHELFHYERLKKCFETVWDNIQAEAIHDINFTAHYGTEQRQLIIQQQKAFWDLHRPHTNEIILEITDFHKLQAFKPYFDKHKLPFPLLFPPKQLCEVTLKLARVIRDTSLEPYANI